jgi:hypothetical protein
MTNGYGHGTGYPSWAPAGPGGLGGPVVGAAGVAAAVGAAGVAGAVAPVGPVGPVGPGPAGGRGSNGRAGSRGPARRAQAGRVPSPAQPVANDPTGEFPMLVATPHGSLLHRPDCPVVTRRPGVRAVPAGTEGYGYCSMCDAGEVLA